MSPHPISGGASYVYWSKARDARLAWAAGFFDARGTITLDRRQNISIAIKMVLPDQLQRFQSVVGLGTIYGPYRGRAGRQDWWVYRVTGFEQSQAIIAMLWQWLGSDKRRQAAYRLVVCRESKPREWQVVYRLAGLPIGGPARKPGAKISTTGEEISPRRTGNKL